MALETSTHSRINEGEEANVRRSSLVVERYAVVRSSRWLILSLRSVVQPSLTSDDGKMSNGHMHGSITASVSTDTKHSDGMSPVNVLFYSYTPLRIISTT